MSTQAPSHPTASTLDWIMRLLTIDTTSRNSNLPLVDVVCEQLHAVGVQPILVPSEDGAKANLIATFPAKDGSNEGGVVLSGHTDVVPVDGQAWTSEPFSPQVRDGRIYGRGTCDMKSFVGVVVAKVPDIVARPLAQPIHVALSYDEEVGCTGAVGLVSRMAALGLGPRACVVGEPTGMRIIRGHKSINLIDVDVHGVAAHSSLTPQGVNAIEHAAEFVRFVRSVADGFRQNGPFDEDFDVPFSTATVNLISGGIAVNTLPAECSLSLEFRSIPAVDADALVDRFRSEAERIEHVMQQENPDTRVVLTVRASAPALDTAGDAEVIDLVTGWGGIPSADKVAYGTEAGLFSRAGIPTVVCGPGDIAQAHAADEFIELEQIARCETFIDSVIAHARA